MKELPMPVNTHFKEEFCDFGWMHATSISFCKKSGKPILRHAYAYHRPGNDTFKVYIGEVMMREHAREELLRWFWRRLGAA